MKSLLPAAWIIALALAATRGTPMTNVLSTVLHKWGVNDAESVGDGTREMYL